jgi:flavin-dependent dehydrogenase
VSWIEGVASRDEAERIIEMVRDGMDQIAMNAEAGSPEAMRIAVIGAGPAGSALAILLARQGAEVTLFDDGRRPELLVGESLVPAVVPILRRLGMEEETAAFSRVKPGVSFIWSPADRVSVTFKRFAPAVFPYAYNIPRPRFDQALLERAIASGVRHVPARARLQPATTPGTGAELALAPETLTAAPALGGRPAHLIVDATGRARHAARALAIPARLGPRKDVAYFAHFEDFRWDDAPGQVLIARAQAGWSWCIPLQERLSIGIVLGQDDAARLGRAPEDRLDRGIATDPWLSSIAGDARRATGVATYSNYQLISERGHGRGWVMVGDAFGFIDPMLSPGVFLALRSAELLADALAPWLGRQAIPSPAELDAALTAYSGRQHAMLSAWFELVAYLYDGRLVALMRAGRTWKASGSGLLKDVAEHYIARHVGLLASGAATTSRYSRGLLRFLSRHALRGFDPKDFAIR